MDWQIRRIGIYTPVFAHTDTPVRGRADMEIVILLVIAFIVIETRFNKKVSHALSVETDTIEKAKLGFNLGLGWIMVIGLVFWLILGAAVGFANINVGTNPDGSFTFTQPHDPNNPFTYPVSQLPARFSEFMANDGTIPSATGSASRSQSGGYWETNGVGPNGQPFKRHCDATNQCGPWVPQ